MKRKLSILIVFVCTGVFSFILTARDITTLDGQTYKNVQISSVTPIGFDISYTPPGGGLAIRELSFKNLPKNIRKEYGYNPVKAEAFSERIAEIRRREYRRNARMEELKKEQNAKNEMLTNEIYSRKMKVLLKAIEVISDGTVCWAQTPYATVTTGQLGKVCVCGLELTQGNEWNGFIYPTGKTVPYGGAQIDVYSTSLENALYIFRNSSQQSPAGRPQQNRIRREAVNPVIR